MKDDFGKYKIRISVDTAVRILNLINNNIDFSNLTISEVLGINMVTDQLEEIVSKELRNV
jgi:hypothetical protein